MSAKHGQFAWLARAHWFYRCDILVSTNFRSPHDSQGNGKSFEDCYDDFHRKYLLGEGGFASVFRAQHRRNKSYYAVKEVIQSEYDDSTSDLKDEIEAMKRLRDVSYTVRLHDVFQVGKDRTFLVMEEIAGGDLLDRLTEKITYTEKEARKVVRTLLEAIRCCHRKGPYWSPMMLEETEVGLFQTNVAHVLSLL
jgi:serine/threonine protein kinase